MEKRPYNRCIQLADEKVDYPPVEEKPLLDQIHAAYAKRPRTVLVESARATQEGVTRGEGRWERSGFDGAPQRAVGNAFERC